MVPCASAHRICPFFRKKNYTPQGSRPAASRGFLLAAKLLCFFRRGANGENFSGAHDKWTLPDGNALTPEKAPVDFFEQKSGKGGKTMKLGVLHATVKKNQMIRVRAYPINFSPAICSPCFTPCWVRGFPAPHVCGKPFPALAENCGRAFLPCNWQGFVL